MRSPLIHRRFRVPWTSWNLFVTAGRGWMVSISRSDDEFIGDYLCVSITRYFHLGSKHMFYDGPNCSFSLGFVHVVWDLGWCDRCWDER